VNETMELTGTSAMRAVDGQLYEITITADAEVVRGPLGRFIDLADQIRSEGLEVPPEIDAVLNALQQPKESA
jgi:hypothetical protein